MAENTAPAGVSSAERAGSTADFDLWLRTGCRCTALCFGGVDQKVCCYFIARTRGPVTFGPCSLCTGKTYHDGTGACLICGTNTGERRTP